jgi:hypothetical protein
MSLHQEEAVSDQVIIPEHFPKMGASLSKISLFE